MTQIEIVLCSKCGKSTELEEIWHNHGKCRLCKTEKDINLYFVKINKKKSLKRKDNRTLIKNI